MRTIFLVLSATLTILDTIPYITNVLRKNTKPRIVSWFNWSLLAGIAAAAAIADKQYPSAVLSLAATLECMLVVIFGLKFGDRKFEFIDVVCQAGAILGLILWIVFNSPLVAIVASASIDFIASLPTIKHIWQKPNEETVSLFILSAIGAFFALAATHHPRVSGLVFPIYIVAINLFTSVLFFLSPNRKAKPSN
jgi:hypothetical protein